jgi:hypothetical protein
MWGLPAIELISSKMKGPERLLEYTHRPITTIRNMSKLLLFIPTDLELLFAFNL